MTVRHTPPLTIDWPEPEFIALEQGAQEINVARKTADGFKVKREQGNKTAHPEFFITPSINGGGYSGFWTLTHGQSGLAFPQTQFETLRAARHLARLLTKIDVPWDKAATGEYMLTATENDMCANALREAKNVDEESAYGAYSSVMELLEGLHTEVNRAISSDHPESALEALRSYMKDKETSDD